MQGRVGEKHSEELVKRCDFSRNAPRIFPREKNDWAFLAHKQVAIVRVEFAKLLGCFQVSNHHSERLLDTVFASAKMPNGVPVGGIRCQMKPTQPFYGDDGARLYLCGSFADRIAA